MKHTTLALSIALFFGVGSLVLSDETARNEFVNITKNTVTTVASATFSYIGRTANMIENRAAVFFVPGISESELRKKYTGIQTVDATTTAISPVAQLSPKKVKILIMPGHEPKFGGTEYGALKERDLTVELAYKLAGFFNNNSHYEVVIPRDKENWNPIFADYFNMQWNDIISFAKKQKDEMRRLLNKGEVKKAVGGVPHNRAKDDVAYRIYGINKWGNENGVDMAIHIHFNDYPRKNESKPGEYSGFAIYVPEKMYSNSSTTKSIADAVFARLKKYYPLSNLPKESDGIVEEQDLIAIGSHNTSDAPSMLIEYAYIYEPALENKISRDEMIEDFAFQTYLGVQDFFGSGNDVTLAYDNLILPYKWKRSISEKSDFSDENVRSDVFALQTALMISGEYPPTGEDLHDCPRSGRFGSCTMSALAEFQKKYKIVGEKGKIEGKTIDKLNELFSAQVI